MPENSPAIASLEPSLKSGDLVKGDKARGHITFEVKSDSSGFVSFYEPVLIFGGYEIISIDLGQ